MNSKKFFVKLIVGFCLPSFLIGCNNNPSEGEKQSEQEQTPATPNMHGGDTYDQGYYDGYIGGYDDGKTAGYNDGFDTGKTEGYTDGYDAGKEDGKAEQEQVNHDFRSIHTESQLQYLNNPNYSIMPNDVVGTSEKSKPIPLEFSIQESPLFSFSEITSSKLRISESQLFNSYIEVDGVNNKFEVYNLKINTKYYYYYFAETTHGTFYSDIKEVNVKNEAPRLLNIDGVTNARDDGGWKIKDQDKYTKQGLLYRMGKLHTSSTKYITPDGIKAFKALGIKTEIDLRNASDGNNIFSCAVDGVSYLNYQMSSSDSYFTNSNNKNAIKQVLETMADQSKYPIMFHCNIGTDRTGFISFIVNALAGVEEEFLYRDYMMSNYANIGGDRDTASITNYINTLKNDFGGSEDLSVGAKNYMLNIGVAENKINSIKSILVG